MYSVHSSPTYRFIKLFALSGLTAALLSFTGTITASDDGGLEDMGSEIKEYFKHRPTANTLLNIRAEVDRHITDTALMVPELESMIDPNTAMSDAEMSTMMGHLESKISQLDTYSSDLQNLSAEMSPNAGVEPLAISVSQKVTEFSSMLKDIHDGSSQEEKDEALSALKDQIQAHDNAESRTNLVPIQEEFPVWSPVDGEPMVEPGEVIAGSLALGVDHSDVIIDNNSWYYPGQLLAVKKKQKEPVDQGQQPESVVSLTLDKLLHTVVPPSFANTQTTTPSSSEPITYADLASCYANQSDYNSNISADLNLRQPELEVAQDVDTEAYQQLTELAAELDYSPVKIMEYVTNNIKHEHYHGSVKGALGVLQSGNANDLDHASLLIALLRISGIPARYVRGHIYIQDKQEHLDWWNVKDFAAAKNVIRRSAKQFIADAGLIDNSQAFRKAHVWVEACVPYSNYRANDVTNPDAREGFRWVQLDASFKNYERSDGISQNVNFDYDRFLSKLTRKLPHDIYQDQVLEYARSIDPNYTLDDVGTRWKQKKIALEFLPDSLPYIVENYYSWGGGVSTSRTAILPSAWRASMSITIANNPAFTIPLTDFTQHRITLSFEGVGSHNFSRYQEFLAGRRVLDCSNSNLTVRPVFKKDGQRIATGNLRGLTLCSGTYPRRIPIVLNAITQGIRLNRLSMDRISPFNYYAFTAYTLNGSDRYINSRSQQLLNTINNTAAPINNLDGTLGEFLHVVLLKYMRYVSDATEQMGVLFGNTGRSGFHMGFTVARPDVEYIFDVPYAVHSNSFAADMPNLSLASRAIEGDVTDYSREAKLWGYSLSHLESYIWQENAETDAISSVTALQVASESGVNTIGRFSTAAQVRSFASICAPNTGSLYSNESLSSLVRKFRRAGFFEADNLAVKRYLLNNNSFFTGYSTEAQIDAALAVPIAPTEYCYNRSYLDSILNISFPSGFDTEFLISKYPVKYKNWVGPAITRLSLQPNNFITHSPIAEYSGSYTISEIAEFTYQPPLSSDNQTDSSDPFIAASYGFQDNSATQGANISQSQESSSPAATTTGVDSLNTTAFDPVNMVSGNMYHEETDIELPTAGLPFIFKRTYNSDVQASGSLGRGWTHTFNQYLRFDDTDNNGVPDLIIWTNGSGAERYIKLKLTVNSLSRYHTFSTDDVVIPDGYYFSLHRSSFYSVLGSFVLQPSSAPRVSCKVNSSTCPDQFLPVEAPSSASPNPFILTEKNGTRYIFEAVSGVEGQTAKLIRIEDPKLTSFRISYDSQSKIQNITDADGRQITFTYYPGSNYINTIEPEWTGDIYEYIYDSQGRLTSYRNPLDSKRGIDSSRYTYYSSADGHNLQHRMESFSYANGYNMTFEYYPNGKTFRHYNAQAETATFSYNEFLRESKTVDELGRVEKYLFNKDGLLIEKTDALGGKETYLYQDSRDPLLRTAVIDAVGYRTNYAYDNRGNLIRETLPSGETVTYQYHDDYGNPRLIKNALNNYRLQRYDIYGNLQDSIVFKSGFGAGIHPDTFVPELNAQQILSWVKNEYDFKLHLGPKLSQTRQVKDFSDSNSGPYTTIAYQEEAESRFVLPNNMTYFGDIDGDGIIAEGEGLGSYDSEYDPQGRLIKGFNSARYPIENRYDLDGRLLESTDPLGYMRKYSYDLSGLLTGQSLFIKNNGKISLADNSSISYDYVNRPIATSDASGATSSVVYDDAGNMIKSTSPDGYTAYFEYDNNNRLIKSFDEEGNTVERKLDLIGRVKQLIDPNGNITNYHYYGPEENGRLKRVTDAESRWTEYEYDAVGQVIRVITNAGRETLSDYDALGRVVRVVSPVYNDITLGAIRPVTTYTYNSLGHQIAIYAGLTDAAGTRAADNLQLQERYVYDDFGRMLKRIDAAGNTWSYEYDVHNNIIRNTDPKGQVTTSIYAYGGILISQVTQGAPGSDTPTQSISYERNVLGQPTKTISNGVTFTYEYDAAHRLVKVTDSRGDKTVSYDYSIGGLLNSITDHHGNRTAYLYDPVGRLTGIRSADNSLVSYIYDAGGRLQQKAFPNNVVSVYEYFKDNRIKSVNTHRDDQVIASHSYSYNDAAEITDAIQQIGTEAFNDQYAYDGLGRLTSYNRNGSQTANEQIAYDVFGNRRQRTVDGEVRVYSHNNLHQITRINKDTADGATIADFTYDANGNMVQKQWSGTTTDINYDALDRVVSIAKNAIPTEYYGYDHGVRRISKTVGSDITNYHYSGPDIIGEYQDNTINPVAVYAHGADMDDPLVHIATNDPQYYHADAMSSVVAMSNKLGQPIANNIYSIWGETTQAQGSTPQYGYTGREPNDNGLIYYRARFYDPEIARFTQLDPKGFIDGINRYTYVMNSPVNYVDPWGTSANTPSITGDSAGIWNANNARLAGDLAVDTFVPGASTARALVDGDYKGAAIEAGIEVASVILGIFTGGAGYVAIKTIKASRAAAKLKKKIDDVCCFVAGTQVLTKHGYKNIEEIELGDEVYSKNIETGEKAYKPVTYLFEKYRLIYELTVIDASGEELVIKTTDDHPFYVSAKGFVNVIDLVAGDEVETENGKAIVRSVINTEEYDSVYNIEVKDFHTYYVTKLDLLVHNCDWGPDVAPKTERVRHFTNSKGVEGIKESNTIQASDQNSVFTVKAKGNPGSPRDVEKQLGIKRGKGNNIVEFDADPSEFDVIKNPSTGATERVFKGNVDLTNRNPIFKKNR